ncbi:hypothetical protein V6N11_014748 [Hibiscus sabdariffa]|uniref:Secreted protein n=1 Tax=Hibiscus sabdariffa TaxID=183260 RepID=A0ABR2TQ00_9ROSI
MARSGLLVMLSLSTSHTIIGRMLWVRMRIFVARACTSIAALKLSVDAEFCWEALGIKNRVNYGSMDPSWSARGRYSQCIMNLCSGPGHRVRPEKFVESLDL